MRSLDLSRDLLDQLMESRPARFWKDVTEHSERASVRIASVFLLPGIIARIGIQEAVSRLVRVRILHEGLGRVLGGYTILADRRRYPILLLIGAPALLLPIGAMLGVQPIIDFVTVGSFIPLPSELDGVAFILPVLTVSAWYGWGSILLMWCSASCWWLSIAPADDVRAAVAACKEQGNYRGVRRGLLGPYLVFASAIDRLGVFSGVAGVLIGFLTTVRVVAWITQWRL